VGLKALLQRLAQGFPPSEVAPQAPNAPDPVGNDLLTPDDLLSAVQAAKSEIALLRLEWAEVLDKITAWANRQAARDRVTMRNLLKEPIPDSDESRVEVEARMAAAETPQLEERNGSISRSKLTRYANRQRR